MKTDDRQPLWLPRGSIRALLALLIVGAYVLGFFDDRALVSLVIGGYFVGRAATPA